MSVSIRECGGGSGSRERPVVRGAAYHQCMLSLGESVVQAAADLLRKHGPMPREQWLAAMVTAGLGTRSELKMFSEGCEHQAVGRFADGRVCAMDTLLEGRILTHRLTETDVRSGVVDTFPDLTPMSLQLNFEDASGIRVVTASRNAPQLADRNREEPDERAIEALVLPPEVGDRMRVGDILGLRFRDGRVQIEDVRVVELRDEDLVARLASAIPQQNAANLDSVMWQLMAADPAMFRTPTLPIGELLAAAGYESYVSMVAVRGFNFKADFLRMACDDWALRFNMDEDGSGAVLEMLRLSTELETGVLADRRALADIVERYPDLFSGLRSRAACEAVLEVSVESGYRLQDLRLIARVIGRLGPEEVQANARWLAESAANRCGG